MKRKELLRNIATVICVGVILFCGAKIAYKEYNYYSSKKLYSEVQKLQPTQVKVAKETNKGEEKETDNKTKQLEEMNSNYVGWIDIEGTNINYPIVKTDDNEFYLKHGFDRTYNYCGAIFMDYRNPSSLTEKESNSIIYGHNMRNDTMFAELQKYRDKQFYEQHKQITIMDKENQENKYEIISVKLYGNEEFQPQFKWNNSSDYVQYLTDIEKTSLYEIDAQITDQPIITLYTCDYSSKGARLVVTAQRIN